MPVTRDGITSLIHYPFTAPEDRPRIRYFWKKMMTQMIGSVTETEAAAASVTWPGSSPPVNCTMPTGRVQFVCIKIRASRKSL